MLFTSAIGYLIVGMTLEYIKRSDIFVLAIMALFRILKIIGGIGDIFSNENSLVFDFEAI